MIATGNAGLGRHLAVSPCVRQFEQEYAARYVLFKRRVLCHWSDAAATGGLTLTELFAVAQDQRKDLLRLPVLTRGERVCFCRCRRSTPLRCLLVGLSRLCDGVL